MEVIATSRIVKIDEAIFTGKQNIPWASVEKYLKRYIDKKYVVEATEDAIYIGSDFPEEFAESRYTKKLRGNLAKAKANAAQKIGELIESAENRRWVENKAEKHEKDALNGWFRYDVKFSMSVRGEDESIERINIYRATLVVRKSSKGLFLYDVINIKKEASMPR